jgi:glycosyltransferase involved in cell wall biosynthesis
VKVLTVVSNMGVGGTERVAQNMSLGLSAAGVDVAVLAYREGGPRETAYREAGLPVFVASGTSDGSAVEAARQWGADVVHIHRGGYADTEETRLLRHLRSDGAKTVETNVFARFDWSEGGRLIDAHCNLSKWCAFKWHAWGGRAARAKRSFILANPIDTDSIRPLSEASRQQVRAGLGIPPGRFVFGRVGRPAMAKWSPAIIKAFQEVLPYHDIGLLLVGAPPEIVRMISQLPDYVRSRIIQVEPTYSDEKLYSLFGAMDGFLHISEIGESFGMVLCEAMVAGVPVVTLSTPLKDNSQLEVVGHEKGGLIALSTDAVPTAMHRLITDSQIREAVRNGGRAWVADRFGIDVVSRKALAIYESVLSDVHVTSPADDVDAPPNRAWILNILSKGIGSPVMDTRTALTFELLHTPFIYRAYLAARPLLKCKRPVSLSIAQKSSPYRCAKSDIRKA